MKILHLIDIPWWSGLSAYAFDCAQSQMEMGHRVWVGCEAGSLFHKRAQGAGWDAIPLSGRAARHSVSNFFKVGRILERISPDRIVAHTGSTHWIAWQWSCLKKIPVIRTRAIARPVKKSFFNRKIYSDTQAVVAASNHLREEFLHWLPGSDKKVFALYPPVRNPAFDVSAPFSFDAGVIEKKRVGILGRLDPKKGYEDFLAAAALVQRDHPDCEFHIAGSEEQWSWPQILNRAKSLGLKRIVYHGFLPEDRVWGFLESCRVGVIASRESEEVSRALLEWMSAGRPVVATKVGCIPEILKEGEEGFLVPPNDPAALAQKIKTFLQRPDLCKAMGERAFERSRKNFSGPVFRAAWHKILYPDE